MKKILLMALSILFLISTAACANEGQVYENQQYGFRITLPNEWSIQESPSKSSHILESISPDGLPRLSISITGKMPDELSIEDAQESLTKAIFEKLPESYNVKEIRYMTIAGSKAARILISNNEFYNINYTFRFRSYYIVIMSIGSLSNYESDKEIIDRSVATFTKLNKYHLNK